ncbi:MAG TPA: DUF4249 domain-containing protein [Puia sp.]|nr:DUF4249 domain-containing protein [Puia sp.]
MKRRYAICLLLAMTVGPACKKTIQVDLHEASSKVVIEGEVTDIPGPYQVKISRTVPYTDNNIFPPVQGADVQITDSNNGVVYSGVETSSGVYSMNFTGVTRHTYQLTVNVDGQQYTASSTMPQAVALDSVSFAVNTNFNGKKEINAMVNFQDPPGLGNYYQFIEYINGRQVPNIFVFEDRLSDARYIQEPLYNDSAYLQKKDTLLIKMYCVDKAIYDYFFSLAQIVGNNGGFQSASPANPNTNIIGGALGYFSVHTVREEKMLVY